MAKSHIFSGKEPSRAEKASIKATLAEMEARREGIQPGAKPRSIAEKEKWAEELAQRAAEAAEKRREEERKQREEEAERSAEFQRRQPIRDALESGNSADIISALYRVVPSDEQDLLDEYDSNELVAIAEIYGNGSMPLSEAIEKYEEQRAEAEEEMERGEYEVNWEEEDLF